MRPFSRTSTGALVTAFVLAILAAPVSTRAQEATTKPGADGPTEVQAKANVKLRTVVKTVRYADVEDLQPILQMLRVQVRLQPDTNSIVLRGNPDGDIETALRLIEALDQPSPSIELTVFVLAASQTEIDGSSVPADLEPTVDHLGSIFGYGGFDLLDSVYLRVLEGRPGRVEGGVELNRGSGRRTGYKLAFGDVRFIPTEEGQRRIRLDSLSFHLEGEQGGVVQRASLNTDVVIREGQKAVVGKSTPQGAEQTLILVVEATVETPEEGAVE